MFFVRCSDDSENVRKVSKNIPVSQINIKKTQWRCQHHILKDLSWFVHSSVFHSVHDFLISMIFCNCPYDGVGEGVGGRSPLHLNEFSSNNPNTFFLFFDQPELTLLSEKTEYVPLFEQAKSWRWPWHGLDIVNNRSRNRGDDRVLCIVREKVPTRGAVGHRHAFMNGIA